jgi:hypothetical protein
LGFLRAPNSSLNRYVDDPAVVCRDQRAVPRFVHESRPGRTRTLGPAGVGHVMGAATNPRKPTGVYHARRSNGDGSRNVSHKAPQRVAGMHCSGLGWWRPNESSEFCGSVEQENRQPFPTSAAAWGDRSASPYVVIQSQVPQCDLRFHHLLAGNSAVRRRLHGDCQGQTFAAGEPRQHLR